jgi:hypothetical protein
MNKLYTKPIDNECMKLFNINENSYIQTSNLSKESHYDIQCIIWLFENILKDLDDNYQNIIRFNSHNILDNPTILSLIKVEYDLSKNTIIKLAQHLFNKFNNNELKETLDYINKLNISDIDNMYEDTFNEYIYNISTDISDYIGKLPFNEISQIYCEYQTIPPKLIEEVKKIIFEK